MDNLGTWNGLVTVPYDDFIVGIEAIKELSTLKKYIRNADYVSAEVIKDMLGEKKDVKN